MFQWERRGLEEEEEEEEEEESNIRLECEEEQHREPLSNDGYSNRNCNTLSNECTG
jgi:hypothetical protein